MTQPVRPRQYVSSPAFTPLPFGLLNALASEIRSPSDNHWQGGVTYETLCAAGDTTYDECFAVSGTGSTAVPAEPSSKAETTSIVTRGATAFTVFAEVDCSVPGFWERAEEFGAKALAQSEQYQVERAIWTGQADGTTIVFPHLAADTQIFDSSGYLLQSAATLPVTGTGLDVVEALGRLEGSLADCYNGVGVIHIPRDLVAAFQNENLIIVDGPRYKTANGNIVVLGSGYTGSAPDGTSSDSYMWIYGTGMPFIYRGPITVMRARDSIDRATNTLMAIAERTYVIGWDCCHVAVSVSLGGIVAGTSGE
jgi:hypothetical protein